MPKLSIEVGVKSLPETWKKDLEEVLIKAFGDNISIKFTEETEEDEGIEILYKGQRFRKV